MTDTMVYIIMGLCFLMAIVGFGIKIYQKKKKKGGKSRREAVYYRLYLEFLKIPVANQYVTKMSQRLKLMSVFTKREIYARSAMYFVLQACCLFGCLIVGLLLFEDPVSLFFCVALAYFIPNNLINKRMGHMYARVYIQLGIAIESLRLQYLRCGSVVEALENAECGNRLVKAFDEIHRILVSADSEKLMLEFYDMVPFLPIQTLAQVCYHTENTGDSTTREGRSSFEESLLMMSKDINKELERLNYQADRFGNSEYLCLISFPMIPIMQWFLLTYMPGCAVLLQGLYGFLSRVAIMGFSLYGFHYVSTRNSMEPFKLDDRIPFIHRIWRWPWVHALMRDVAPKNAKRRVWQRKLDAAFSKKTLEEFWLEKCLLTGFVSVFILATFVSAIVVGKNYMLNSTSSLSLTSQNELEGYEEEDILELDAIYMEMRDGGYTFQEEEEIEELEALIRIHLPGLSELQVYDQRERLEKKYTFLKNAVFKWYYVPISVAIGCAAWFIPNLQLKDRTKQLKDAEQEEFLQIQTFMMTLIGMNCDNMELLEYLGYLAKIHKDMFVRAAIGYPSDPDGEIELMVRHAPMDDFKRFLDKLHLTVEELSLPEAYASLLLEREHIVNERVEEQKLAIDAKRASCTKYIMGGAILCGILIFTAPLLITGMTDVMSGIESMRQL